MGDPLAPARDLLANITGAPESYQAGIVAAGPIRERPADEDDDFPAFTRIVVSEDGKWYAVTVRETIDNGTGL